MAVFMECFPFNSDTIVSHTYAQTQVHIYICVANSQNKTRTVAGLVGVVLTVIRQFYQLVGNGMPLYFRLFTAEW